VAASIKITRLFANDAEPRGHREISARSAFLENEDFQLFENDADMAKSHPVVGRLRVVHSNVRKGIACLLKDLTLELEATTSGNPVTRDGYISWITISENINEEIDTRERIDKRMVVDLHLCKAQAVK
jgi:hypothetical protein